MRRSSFLTLTVTTAALTLLACGDDGGGSTGGGAATSSSSSGGSGGTGGAGGAGGTGGDGGGPERPPAAEDWTRDIVSIGLDLDLAALTGKATIALAPSASSTSASFEIGDLEITAVHDAAGPLEHEADAGQLNIGVPRAAAGATVVVDYKLKPHAQFDGWMPDQGLTFLWPYFCGNLFPCKSDPADGLSFSLRVTGVAQDQTAVYPTSIPADAPSYMPAVAVGRFTQVDLGTTTRGTQVSVWQRPGEEAAAQQGTAHLVDVFDFFETTYGAYTFGDSVGTVSADWGPSSYGGMEHHPFWHVGASDLASEDVNAHEAAHGWFGNGVRIACWEDFILSEGTVTYMAAHALEQVGVDLWESYSCQLKAICDPATSLNTVALPDTCNEIDLLNDPLWSPVPYMKGAFFFRAVREILGVQVLDEAIAEFYAAHVGTAARMQQLIDHIKTKADPAGAAAIDQLVTRWLRTLDCPVDLATLCTDGGNTRGAVKRSPKQPSRHRFPYIHRHHP